jgi:tetratricopeptide (TPR) repeat protein
LQTKWTALIRVEVAQQTDVIVDNGLRTEQSLSFLQTTVNRLVAEVEDVRRQDSIQPSDEDASQAYLRYRAQKLQDEMDNLAVTNAALPGLWRHDGWSPPVMASGGSQELLDQAVDALVDCSAVLASPGVSLDDMFAAMEKAAVCTAHAHMRLEAMAILLQAESFARSLGTNSQSEPAIIWLARLLACRARMQAGTSDHEKATEASQEAVQIARGLSLSSSANHRALLTYTLLCSGVAFERGHQLQLAADAAEEALGHARILVKAEPVYKDQYYLTLSHVINSCLHAYKYRTAVVLSAEILEIREQSVAAAPDDARCLHHLAISLADYALALFYINRANEALEPALRAVTLTRKAGIGSPTGRAIYLPAQLVILSRVQCRLEQFDGALASAEEATRLWRDLLASKPDSACQERLALALEAVHKAAAGSGNLSLAGSAMEESVSISRAAFASSPQPTPSASLQLSQTLFTLSCHQETLGQVDTAIAFLHEAQDILKSTAFADSGDKVLAGITLSKLAANWWHTSELQSKAGRPSEALSAAQECVRLSRQVHATWPWEHSLYNVKDGLERLLECHEVLGQDEKASRVRTEIQEVDVEMAADSVNRVDVTAVAVRGTSQ